MAKNPMQRKARNSFLLGMLVAILIAGVIIALLFMQLINLKKQQEEEEASYVNAYVLTTDVNSGGEITADDLQLVQTKRDNAPTDLLNIADLGEKTTAKVQLTQGTILSVGMVNIDEKPITNDVRKEEYNMISLPTQLTAGEYIDIRLMMPSGQNFIVISKKQVEIPQVAGVDSADTIWLNLSEDEILLMSNAIVDAYKIPGSKLYAIPYVEPGLQESATPTYEPSSEVIELINGDPNIVNEARNALAVRYKETELKFRGRYIQPEINNNAEMSDSNVQTGMEESITKSQEERQQYLQSLSSGY